ncbi:hypothetical protein QMO46_10885 [Microbacterium barkeri]|uniref:hypothetical protein n=1 Tax=Microbacterium barkeri TaxID=33917 RepID=UPI0024AF7731|nr:hypothetical protein [Microbacterium barkeri]MDI6944001.1 hypothetical protein [Microbacterium barkeri]
MLVQLETATREELAPEEAKALEAPAEGVLSGRSESGVEMTSRVSLQRNVTM